MLLLLLLLLLLQKAFQGLGHTKGILRG